MKNRKVIIVNDDLDYSQLISKIDFHFDGNYGPQAMSMQSALSKGEMFVLEGDKTYMFFNIKGLTSVLYAGWVEFMQYDSIESFLAAIKICFLSRKNFIGSTEMDKLPENLKTYLLNNAKQLKG